LRASIAVGFCPKLAMSLFAFRLLEITIDATFLNTILDIARTFSTQSRYFPDTYALNVVECNETAPMDKIQYDDG